MDPRFADAEDDKTAPIFTNGVETEPKIVCIIVINGKSYHLIVVLVTEKFG